MPETAGATTITPHLSPTALAVYRATAERRATEAMRELAARRARAQEVAQQAAALLKEQFGATQVVVFGSTVHGHWFTATSDIDLAARGLAPDDYFTAVARLQDLSPEFKVDLVAVERCKAALRESIAREGVIL
ncbi:MAG: nucleotidyltransferase domain-containing protein [Anaerolineae bacterium]